MPQGQIAYFAMQIRLGYNTGTMNALMRLPQPVTCTAASAGAAAFIATTKTTTIKG